MGAGGIPTIAGYDSLTPVDLDPGLASHYGGRAEAADRWVMLSVFPVALADDAGRRRFLRDLEQASLVRHPGLVVPVDAGVCSDGRPYVAAELDLFAGGTLADAVRRGGPFAVGDAVGLGVALSSAVAAAHSAGELHLWISPACVLLPPGAGPLLAGLGLGAVAADATASSPRYFAAPEQLERRTAGTGADVYSLAATIYATLAGRAPHEPRPIDPPDSAPALLLRTLQNDVPPVDRPDLPESLTAILRDALDRDPARRTPSAASLGQALQDFQRAHRLTPTTTPPPPPPPPPPDLPLLPGTARGLPPDPAPPAAPPPPPAAPPEPVEAAAGSPSEPVPSTARAPDTLTDFWPGAVAPLGPHAGEATSPVWVEAAPARDTVAAPPEPATTPAPAPAEPAAAPPPEPAAPLPAPPEPAAPLPAPAEPAVVASPEAGAGHWPPPSSTTGFAPVEPIPAPTAPVPPPFPPGPPLVQMPMDEGRGRKGTGAGLGILAAVVVVAVGVGAAFMLRPKDDDPGKDPPASTTTTTTSEAVPVPTGLAASESPAGVQLDWEGDESAIYAVLVMSEAAAPKVLSADEGSSMLVPIAEIAPDVGYCFAVAELTAVEATSDDIASAFSNPACIRGASESSVQQG
jgi:hypothetical protein